MTRFIMGFIMIFMVGCGGGNHSSSSLLLQGQVVDGYIAYATVCYDSNGDGICQKEDEPYTLSDQEGNYKLDVSNKEGKLLVTGGIDIATQKPFEGIFYASAKGNTPLVISPISTLVVTYQHHFGKSLNEAEEKVADFLGIALDELHQDPIALMKTNSKPYRANLKLAKITQAMKLLNPKEEVFELLASTLDTSNSLKKSIETLNIEGKELLETFRSNADEMMDVIDFSNPKQAEAQASLSLEGMVDKLKDDLMVKEISEIKILDFNNYFIGSDALLSNYLNNILQTVHYNATFQELQTLLALSELSINTSMQELIELLAQKEILPRLQKKLRDYLASYTSDTVTALELNNFYQFTLAFDNYQSQYEMSQWDIEQEQKKHYRFDFSKKSFEPYVKNYKLFVNNQRSTTESLLYYRENNHFVATLDNQEVFDMKLIKKERVQGRVALDAYFTTLPLQGIKYTLSKTYKANVYTMKKVVSTEFNNLNSFIQEHQNRPFIGGTSYGLIFTTDNQILTLLEGTYSNGGYYELKTIEDKELLFVYPNDTKNYPKGLCYLVDFDHIEEGVCHLKDAIETLEGYDESVYKGVVNYLQHGFAEVHIEI